VSRTITMMELRKHPGKYAHLVSEHGEEIVVTYQGKPRFKMVHVSDTMVIHPDGTFDGPDLLERRP
jgi:antitoxin (DNA-binding transcriptional repressor) of toxin-antitoxin stability system